MTLTDTRGFTKAGQTGSAFTRPKDEYDSLGLVAKAELHDNQFNQLDQMVVSSLDEDPPTAAAPEVEIAKATDALVAMVGAATATKSTANDSAIAKAFASTTASPPQPTGNLVIDYMNLPNDLDELLADVPGPNRVDFASEVAKARAHTHFGAFLHFMNVEHGLNYDEDDTLVWGDPDSDDPQASLKDWLLFLLKNKLAKQANQTMPSAEETTPALQSEAYAAQHTSPTPPQHETPPTHTAAIEATQPAGVQHDQQIQQTQPEQQQQEAPGSLQPSMAPAASFIDYMNLPDDLDDLFADDDVNIDAEVARAKSSPHFAAFMVNQKTNMVKIMAALGEILLVKTLAKLSKSGLSFCMQTSLPVQLQHLAAQHH